MDNAYLTRLEHTEYVKRMEDEHKRQNKRIDKLETAIEQYGKLTISVEKLATTMQLMLDEQKSQGERLEELENRDGEMWRKAIGYVATAIIGVLIGYVSKQIGM